tara:strand:- start:1111 stop:2763 length:1653 start_codon:yes stop_codon:yes gene_type:complete
MAKESIIVVYIPSTGPYLEQFFGLYYSCVIKTDLYKKFDFLVTGPGCIKDKLPEKHCIFVEVEDLAEHTDCRTKYNNNPYGFINSFAAFNCQKCKDIILQYKQCLRIDVDTFLSKNIENITINDNEIYTGEGAYSSPEARIKLAKILKKNNLTDQNIHNIGSTWYGPSDLIVKYASNAIKFCKYLIKYNFSEHEGIWPQWYAGVITMYAGHLALNSSPLKIIQTNKFDYPSTSQNDAAECYTIHCWHTDNFFSKAHYDAGNYKDSIPDSVSTECRHYSYDCAVGGTQLMNCCKSIDKSRCVENVYALILGGGIFLNDRIKGCLDTWIQYFNNNYLFSIDKYIGPDINHVVTTDITDWNSCPPKIFRGMESVIEKNKNCEWLLIVDDDTFVNSSNLKFLVNTLNVKERKIYGKNMTGHYPWGADTVPFLSGGGGTLIPMHVAREIIKKIKDNKWMSWLVQASRYPPTFFGDTDNPLDRFPFQAGADVKLGWITDKMEIEQVNLPKLFHDEGPGFYDERPENILHSITYHRMGKDDQLNLQSIIDMNISKIA